MKTLALSASMVIRAAKALITLSYGIASFLIALGNILDYRTNFKLVKHVLEMDTVYPESVLKSRAITSPRGQHAAFRLIIFWEILIGALCTIGGLNMFRNLEADAQTFHNAKRAGIAGLLAGVLLFFGGFQTVAGSWFAMWQSKEWNAMPDVVRLTQYSVTSLIFVAMKDDD